MWKAKKEEQRFEKTYTQGKLEGIEIWVDKETGVQYIVHFAGNLGGLTPLLDTDGKPMVDTNYRKTL